MTLKLKKVRANGVELAYYEQGERREDAPTLLFVHATGFHARVWDYQIESFPDHHVLALEQRGHGHSEKLAIESWATFGEDQAAFVSALGLNQLVGVGHSMGAHAMIDAAAISGAFSRLVLLDPTVPSPDAYAGQDGYADSLGDELHPAAKRRNTFASADDMIARISGKSSFPLMHPRILRDYCEYGLVQVESGQYELACPPEIEARVYMAARGNGAVYDSARGLDIPVTIVRAKLPDPDNGHDFSSSPTWPGLVNEFSHGREIHWPDCSHFIPMQKPDEVVEIIKEEVALWHTEANGGKRT